MRNKNDGRAKKLNRGGFQKRTFITSWLFAVPALILMYLFIWRPTVMGFVWSLFKMKGYSPTYFIGIKNYVEVMKDTQFIPLFINTLEYVFWSLVVGFLPPVLLAVVVNEMVHFKQKIMTLLYLPAIIPAIAVSLLWKQMYDPTEIGLLNMILVKFGMSPYQWLNDAHFTILWIVVSMTWKSFPGTMLLYYSALQGVNQELYEAATIDGAGILKRAWYVTRPQIMGVLILNFVRQIIGVFQVMEQPLAMTGGGPDGASASLGYQLYKYGFVTQRVGHAMALGTIIFVVLIFMTIFYFKLNRKLEESL
ncbi:MAG: sugar ABC transporter permease [Clostridia bacterium]|nr:sugar ABC transporter permease [Clostridia bacterium]